MVMVKVDENMKKNAFLDQTYLDMWGINTNEEMFFYYDESNNCRKFWLDYDKTDFNHNPDADLNVGPRTFKNVLLNKYLT